MSDFSAVPANTAEATRDLQDRLGRFARTICVISAVMFAASLVNAFFAGPGAAPISRPSRIVHVLATILALVVWRLGCGKALGVRTIQVLDAALTLTLCTCWALVGIGIAPQEPVEFSIILATSYTLIARSVLVPSTFARTLVVSVVSTVPTMIFFVTRGMSFVQGAPAAQVRTFLLFATVWCLVAAITSALQSRLLYGLRRRIREAMKLGQYTLEEKIGEGGMGVVYRATHAMLRRPAAIKLLLAERAGEKDLARFEREVQYTSRLLHPNTISIFDYGRSADGTFYYVMEYLNGFDLEWLVEAEGPLEPSRVIRILSQASGALVEAHGLGLIHRDIKPANLILTERSDEADVVKVVDFGLVKTLSNGPEDPSVTNADAITGTPLYLAPESIAAPDTVDGRADLYALGAVGYFLLTGGPVFQANTIVEVCSKHLLELPIPPSVRLGSSVPAKLEEVILACLAKSPNDRPKSAAALKEALVACAHTTPEDALAARRWWEERAPLLRTRRNSEHRSKSGDRQPNATMAIDSERPSHAAFTISLKKEPMTLLKSAGVVLIACSLAFIAVFSYLAAAFGYPAILDHGAADVLPRLLAGGARLRTVWFLYSALPLGIVFAGAASAQVLERGGRALRNLGVAAAAAAGIAMMIGLLRWPTIEWTLAGYWQMAPAPSRTALSAIFEASNLYLGNVFGEFVGEMCTALWFVTLGLAFRRDGRRAFGHLSVVAGLLVAVSGLRNITASVALVAQINNVTLPLWLITLGVLFLRDPTHPR